MPLRCGSKVLSLQLKFIIGSLVLLTTPGPYPNPLCHANANLSMVTSLNLWCGNDDDGDDDGDDDNDDDNEEKGVARQVVGGWRWSILRLPSPNIGARQLNIGARELIR